VEVVVDKLSCCKSASFVSERDLDSAGGFDFTLGKCSSCGTPWMSVFCGASSVSGYEPVSDEDLAAIRRMTDRKEIKPFMRAWADRHL
jgi:hypothetical protein